MGALGNTPRSTTVISVEARKSFALGLEFTTEAGVAVDLTGATVRLVLAQQPRNGGAVLLTETAVAVDLEGGEVRFELQAADLDLDEGEYPFAITLVTAEDYSVAVAKGVFDVRENVDLDDTNVYTGITPPQSLTVELGEQSVLSVRLATMPPPALVIGDVTTLSPGQPAAAAFSGAYPHQRLHLSIPKGDAGSQGSPGNPGTPGLSAYQVAVANGFVGDEAAWLLSIKGAKGDPGEGSVNSVNGDLGPDIVLEAGDVGAAPAIHTHDYAPSAHTHDDRYYTETEIDALLDGEQSSTSQQSFGRMVFSAFDNNEMRARFYISDDAGKSFVSIPGSTPYADPDAAIGVRDAAFERAGGQYILAHTRALLSNYLGTSTNWGLAVSDDLRTFTNLVTVNPGIAGIDRCWAPDLMVDGDTVYCYYAVRTSSSGGNFQIYVQSANISDLTVWSAPAVVSGLGANVIDLTVKPDGNGGYVGVVKNESTARLWRCTATSPLGPFTLDAAELPTGGGAMEGPALVRKPGGGWRLVYDAYGADVLYFMDTDDFLTWTARTAITRPATNLRHPGVLWLSHDEDRALQAKWSSVEAAGSITKIVGPITQAAYDAIASPAADTLYVVVG